MKAASAGAPRPRTASEASAYSAAQPAVVTASRKARFPIPYWSGLFAA